MAKIAIRWWMKSISIYYMLLCFINSGFARRVRLNTNCPENCFCNTVSKIVYCSRRGISTIPENLPEGSKQLNLNGNMFDVPILQKSNFSRAAFLEHIYMSECGIEKIEQGTFEDMVNLQWLDISNNRITLIEDYTFRGLSLAHLFLNGNRNLKLEPRAFREMSTTGLYLHECSLSEIQFEVFRPLNGTLQYLWLNGNALERIGKKFQSIFITLSHLRLGMNPIHCNCESLWLKEFYDKNQPIFLGFEAPSCLTPQKLRGNLFSEITLYDFTCISPVFKNIDVVLENKHKMLRCTAVGDPTPTLYWISPTGISVKYIPSDINAKYNQAILNISALKIGKPDISGQYFCLAINEAGNMTFTFNVSWPVIDPFKTTTTWQSLPPSMDNNQDGVTLNPGNIDIHNSNNRNKNNPDKTITTRDPFQSNDPKAKPTSVYNGNSRTSTIYSDYHYNNGRSNRRKTKSNYNPTPSAEGNNVNNRQNTRINNDNPHYISNSNNNNNNHQASHSSSFNSIYVRTNTSDNNIDQILTEDRFTTKTRNGERLYTLIELIGAVIGTLVCTLLLCLLVITLFFKRKWKTGSSAESSPSSSGSSGSGISLLKRGSKNKGRHLPSVNSLEKPPIKGGENCMYLPPVVTSGNQYEGKITKTYRDYYFDSPSPIKR